MVKRLRPRGFTIIEVALFLALSGLLMIGLIVGTNASISRQRYNDSVNNFAEFLRTAYNDVANISNDNTSSAGNSNTAVYGKLITFGEATENDAGTITPFSDVYVYDVAGYAVNSSYLTDSNTIEVLKKVQANIVYDLNRDNPSNSAKNYTFYRRTSYTIPWIASFEQPGTNKRYYGMLLIVRSPISGTIQTFSLTYYDQSQVPNFSYAIANNPASIIDFSAVLDTLERADVTICIDSEDNHSDHRRAVHLDRHAVNSSGVALIDLDAADNPCAKPADGASVSGSYPLQ